jgi:hypothetical protein
MFLVWFFRHPYSIDGSSWLHPWSPCPLSCATFAQWVIFLPAVANSFRGPQFPQVRIFLKTFLLRHATAAWWDTFLQVAANFLRDPQSSRLSFFRSPPHHAVRCWPLCCFFDVYEDFTVASSVGTSQCSPVDCIISGVGSIFCRFASVTSWRIILSSQLAFISASINFWVVIISAIISIICSIFLVWWYTFYSRSSRSNPIPLLTPVVICRSD